MRAEILAAVRIALRLAKKSGRLMLTEACAITTLQGRQSATDFTGMLPVF
ncbi:hypothetical protein [Brucella intermedia]|nr:hypothetical protein [Brucella intermedia]